MANTMTMQEQIEMSGLEIMISLPSSSSSSSSLSSQLQWNSTNQWSPLLGGGREYQACVTIESGSAGGQSIVVIGGRMESGEYTNSIIVWDPSTKRWRNGPSLNDRRASLVAVVCRDKVYVIGGVGHDYGSYTILDTIESIQVSSLLGTMETSTMTRQNNNQWTRLQCRLSSPRMKCAAVVVHNHYIVILGGHTGMGHHLSSVDILDTAPPHNNNNNNNSNGEPTIVAGPSMNSTRYDFGAAVVDNRIFVVGGHVNSEPSTSVESLLFQQQPLDKDHTNSNSNASCMFPNSSWRMERHLSLSSPPNSHAVAKVGSCLVAAGGCTRSALQGTVEVLDIHQGVVWSLPNLNIWRLCGCSMVTLYDCLLVLGGGRSEVCVESLALTVYQKHERCFKFLKFLIEIEFLGRPNRKRDKTLTTIKMIYNPFRGKHILLFLF